MATTVNNPIATLGATAYLTGGAAPAPATANVNQALSRNPTVGSSAFNVQYVFSEAFAVTYGTPFSVDLTSVTDALGNAIDFSYITDIFVKNLSVTSGQNMTVGGSITNTIMTVCPFTLIAQPQLSGCELSGLELAVNSGAKVLEINVAAGTSVAGQLTVFGR